MAGAASAPVAPRAVLWGRLSRTGLTCGLVGVWIALSPSLLPRAWWMTAVSVTLTVVVAYAVGSLVGWLARSVAPMIGLRVEMKQAARRWMGRGWFAVLAVATVFTWRDSHTYQIEVARLVGGTSPTAWTQAIGLSVGILGALVLLELARSIRLLFLRVDASLRRRLPRWLLPGLLSLGLVTVLVFATNQLLYRQVFDYLLRQAEENNLAVIPGSTRPLESERSGSPASAERWDDLGARGRALVSSGPRAAEIEAVTGEPAMEPIRVYAGLVHGRSLEEAAEVVVQELHRTGGFERSALLIVTTTGSGWVPEWSLQSVEYLTGGDVAIATMQYSYFPSGLAYVSNRQAPAEAGALLFHRLRQEWAALPEDDRPLLLAAGESLGSYGGQAAFTDPEDMLAQLDGAVWSGTPRFTPIWAELTASRRPGTPEIAPVIDNGRHFRFVTRPEELWHDYYGGPYLDWEEPRVVYAQHPSDPVVWWSPDLLTYQPQWMRESVGHDVSPQMTWRPWATFWQIALDMPISGSVPGGSGHNYHTEMVQIWAAVLGIETDVARFRAIEDAMTDTIPD